MPAHLTDLPGHLEAWGVRLDDEEADPAVPLPSCPDGRCQDVRPTPARDECLGPVYDVVVPVTDRPGPDAGHIRARIRLGDTQGGDLVAREHGRNEPLLLVVRA